jgi:CRISPR/Cas system CSM-associated protein Csm3 (group 7 of RAMP superfamily)
VEKQLKGERFTNRYRITGKLTTLSPLHIGSGEESTLVYSQNERESLQERLGKVPAVSTVLKDVRGKPIIPGSSLRGVLRHWLLDVLTDFGPMWATERDYADPTLVDLTQAEQLSKVKTEFSWLELLFGTPFHEGKLEVWDAICLTESLPGPDPLLNWNKDSLTYVDTSVAIDPETGTALAHLLYKTEVVPPGVDFELNVVGQNLSTIEMGLILLALQGFNSAIYPIQIGARGGRGYGRVQFNPGPVYRLDQANVKQWLRAAIANAAVIGDSIASANVFEGQDAAGYYGLPRMDTTEQMQLITHVKATMIDELDT